MIEREERQFNRTLEAGTGLLEEALIPLTSAERVVGRLAESLPPDAPVLPGDVAFRLHDTYGFPIDLTVELAAEYGVAHGPRRLRGLARGAADAQPGGHEGGPREDGRARARCTTRSLTRLGATEFLGYDTTTAEGRVVAILRDGIEYETLEAVAEIELRTDASRAPSSSSTGRRSTPRAAARSPTPACIRGRADGSVAVRRSTTSSASPGPSAGLTVHRGVLHGKVAVGERVLAFVDSGPARGHDAQPHGHAPAPPRAAERRRRVGAPGRLARASRLPALRLPVRPRADRGREARDRGRGAAHRPRRPAGDRSNG